VKKYEAATMGVSGGSMLACLLFWAICFTVLPPEFWNGLPEAVRAIVVFWGLIGTYGMAVQYPYWKPKTWKMEK
jgi:hypothetical protein